MTTDLTMLKASLEASQAALQAATYALQSVQAAVSALLLQPVPAQPQGLPMQNPHKETEAKLVAAKSPPQEPQVLGAAANTFELELHSEDPALEPLTAADRAEINGGLGKLHPAELKNFTIAFREEFAVPAEVQKIKGEITQKRHRDWILQYLAEAPNAGGE